MSALYDEKAVRILHDTHWTSKGWRRPFVTAPSDLAYAIRKGLMFPPALFPHDATLKRLHKLCDSLSPARVGDAFLASLGSNELALRSPLGSFAVARFRPAHKFAPGPYSSACNDCGLYRKPTRKQATNLNVLNFERLKCGGVRHTDAAYQLFDLEQFCLLPACPPTDGDITIFGDILETIRTLPSDATVGHLEKAIAKVVPSNKSERRQLIEVLSLSGVLAYPGYRNYFDDTEPPKDRPYRDTDWGVPAMYWRARDGYNVKRLKEYFPKHASQLAKA